jgi:rhodanese-related sulfurtransferase
VILVCADGYSSSLAAATLQELGFARATDVIGGFNAWKRHGLPAVPAPPPEQGRAGMGAPLPA